MADYTVYYSRFAFIFLIYAILTSGYLTKTLSCQMRQYISTTVYGQHVLGLLMVFVFIMMEGGWSFDKEEDALKSNNWSSGHVIHTLMMAVVIYAAFIISSKSRLVPNFIFFGVLFVLYCINTQRAYWFARERITPKINDAIVRIQIVLFAIAIAALLYGFVDYILYQRASYGARFSWPIFLFGSHSCSSFEK